MAKQKKIQEAKDTSAEEKIKEAARKLFTQKGFDAVKTRDIAEEAGLNLALLNYYFRSKQKLFDLIMIENIQQFVQTIVLRISESNLSVTEKVEKVVEAYIDMISANPYLPIFVMNQMHNVPGKLVDKMEPILRPVRENFMHQLAEAAKRGEIKPIHPFHFVANLMGLTVFPFIGRPLIQRVSGANNEEFARLIQERKKLIPVWIQAMLAPE